ncbi:unnamed protein product [Blepharisma stoltei]|uniref:Uncharacterized protein n=1 Tax=Blepharisma stoltei TaxID=1481888 RepID=A0AAU9JSN5_9CILI|nr:unnamed protein product [Blepharisma stoltei]
MFSLRHQTKRAFGKAYEQWNFNILNPITKGYNNNGFVDVSKFETSVQDTDYQRPPQLCHGLNKIVRTEGIYQIDEIIKLNNGDQFIKNLPEIAPKVLERLPTYSPPSKDKILLKKAQDIGLKYIAGSSNVTEALSHIFWVLTNFKSPNFIGLGKSFSDKNMNYMSAYKKPISIMLRKLSDNQYAIDSDKGPLPASNWILTIGGVIMETMFTTEKNLFTKVFDPKATLSEEDKNALKDVSRSYRFRQFGNILIRSQIDTESIDEQGNPFVFEIKTRASAPIRYDVENYNLYTDYLINSRSGYVNSYEREYFDLLRSIILKYLFQIKLGRMDGALIAYHNTKEIFGFEYISVSELEKRVFGNSGKADEVMKICLYILQDILDDAVKLYPDDKMIKIGLYAHNFSGELVTTVERMTHYEEWQEKRTIPEGIEDIYDYYNIYHPNVFALQFKRKLFPYLNGILQKEPIFFEEGDEFAFKQYKYADGVMENEKYLYFLQCSYKDDGVPLDKNFWGVWKKFNDFHYYRRPLHKDTREID